MTNATRPIAVALAIAASGCGLDTPASPTWVDDVRPILAANCARCHGYPAIGGAPDGFRLDVYDDFVTEDGRVLRGAAAMSEFIWVRTDDGSMPPRFGLDDRQREILYRWRQGAVNGDGMPLRGDTQNAPATATLTWPLADSLGADGALVVQYEIRDPDRDIVSGALLAGDDPGSAKRVGWLHSGRGAVVWDVGSEPEGSYKLFAALDDGVADEPLELATYQVSHAGNTAPAVTVAAPIRYDILADAESPAPIRFTVADPDPADTLTVTIEAVRDAERVAIVTAQAITAGDNELTWDTTGLTAGTGWRLELTVDDGTASRSVTVRDLVVSHTSTMLGFADVEVLLATRCVGCHPGADRIPGLTHDFGIYNDDGAIRGVRSLRGLIYRRVFSQRNMPPVSASIFGDDPLSQSERDTLEGWLLGGAPQ